VFATRGSEQLLQHESGMRDLAVGEEVEIDLGDSPDVQVAAEREKTAIDPAQAARLPPPVPGIPALRSMPADDVNRVDISNAGAQEIHFELRLRLSAGARVIRADHRIGSKNGRPIFRVTVPAHDTATVRYQTQRVGG
jgi:hypothetical protein